MFIPPNTQRRGGAAQLITSAGAPSTTSSTPAAAASAAFPQIRLNLVSNSSVVGPLTQLIAGERVYICRAPVKLKEPVANKQYQQPAVQEVLRQIKHLGGDWCIWELLNRKESIVNKFGKEVRNQVLPYRVPELGIASTSFIFGFVSSVLYWLKLDYQNIAIITVHDQTDTHQCMLYALTGVLRHGKDLAIVEDFSSWLRSIKEVINKSLFVREGLPSVRSPLASSTTHGMDPFLQSPHALLPSSRRYLKYLHSILQNKLESAAEISVEPRPYRLKCIMLDYFFGPANSVVVEVYHVHNSMMENGSTDYLKKRMNGSKSARGSDTITPNRTGVTEDEWECIWWGHLKEYQKRMKRLGSSKSKDSSNVRDDLLKQAYQALQKYRLRPLLATNGEILTGDPYVRVKGDQSVSVLPTVSSLQAECLSQRDTTQGSCCQWNFAGNVALVGDVVVIIRQVKPASNNHMKQWANGEAMTNYKSESTDKEHYALTAVHHFNTSFLESECIELNVNDFNFYSPPISDQRHPLSLIGIVNPNFKLHLILARLDTEEAAPGTAPSDVDFLSPTSNQDFDSPRTSIPSAPIVPKLDLEVALKEKSKTSLGRTLRYTNRKLFKISDKSARKSTTTKSTGDASRRDSCATSCDGSMLDGYTDMYDWLKACENNYPTWKLNLELGDMVEFISRHCVQPDPKNLDWIHDIGCSLNELIVCIKCCDNSLGALELADRWFNPSCGKRDERKSPIEQGSTKTIKGFLSKITLGALDFFHADLLTPRETHCRTGSLDQSKPNGGSKMHRMGSAGDILRSGGVRRSPPAELPSLAAARDAFFSTPVTTRVQTDGDALSNQALQRVEKQATGTQPSRQVISVLPNTIYEPSVRPINVVKVNHEDVETAPATAEATNPSTSSPRQSSEPTISAAPKRPALPANLMQALTEKSTNRLKSQSSVPDMTSQAAPAPSRPSLPSGLLSALNTTKPKTGSGKEGANPQQAESTQTQSRPKLPTDLSAALLSRSTVPAQMDGPPPSLSNALKSGIAGGRNSLKKSAPMARKTETTTTSTPQQKTESSGGLAALFAKRATEMAGGEAVPAPKKAPLGRKLFWKPLETENLNDTIFGELDESSQLSFSLNKEIMNKVFSKEAKKAAAGKRASVGGASRGSQPANNPPAGSPETNDKVVTIIEDRRAQNVGIVILRLKTTPAELAKQLIVMELPKTTASEMLEKLELIFFTDEEEQALDKHFKSGGTEEELRDVPERRLLPLRESAVPRGQARTRILGADIKWPVWVEEMESSLKVIRQASAEMRSCACFRAMLSAVLRWGNFVNYGSNELHIKAITLSSLLKLTEFKTNVDSKITSLHYIVATLLTSTDQIEDALAFARMTSEMKSVKAAAKVTSEGLESVWKQLQSAKDFVVNEMTVYSKCYEDIVEADGTRVPRGMTKLKDVHNRMDCELTKLDAEARETMSLVQSTAKFFGDDDAPSAGGKQFHVGSVFATLDEFLRKFDECVRDITRRAALYASILSEEQTPQLIKFVTMFTGKPPSKSAMMAIEAQQNLHRLERAKSSQTDVVQT